jgi:hypothetical protein
MSPDYSAVCPSLVLAQVAAALPPSVHGNIIVIGSLAAGYRLLGSDSDLQVRTKDIDCVLSPHIEAAQAGRVITQALLDSGWSPRTEGPHEQPANADTPDEELPAVRLYPPGTKDWFIELLTVPESQNDMGRHWTRLSLPSGRDYGLPSFTFTGLQTYGAQTTEFGIACAQPEMMALAHLLEHRRITDDAIEGTDYNGRKVKRSNKDLGRVLAIAWLSGDREAWPDAWAAALQHCLPERWHDLALTAGDGLRELLGSDENIQEAFYTCANGLLSSRNVSAEELKITGQRLLLDSIEPLRDIAALAE